MGRLHPGTDRKKYDEADLDRFMGSLNSVLNELIRRKEESTVNIIRCETEYGRQIEVIN
jgi:endonuclease IV